MLILPAKIFMRVAAERSSLTALPSALQRQLLCLLKASPIPVPSSADHGAPGRMQTEGSKTLLSHCHGHIRATWRQPQLAQGRRHSLDTQLPAPAQHWEPKPQPHPPFPPGGHQESINSLKSYRIVETPPIINRGHYQILH